SIAVAMCREQVLALDVDFRQPLAGMRSREVRLHGFGEVDEARHEPFPRRVALARALQLLAGILADRLEIAEAPGARVGDDQRLLDEARDQVRHVSRSDLVPCADLRCGVEGP